MKIFKKTALLLSVVAVCFGCAKEYDDSELRGRIESLETWQKTVNDQIVALQGLVGALENKDYVTSVTELADKSGYVIAFSKSGPITIKHGQKGADATAPVVGVKKDTDDKYYWTLDGEFLITGGNKIPTTGDKGETGSNGLTPHIGTNGNWWVGTTDTGVKAQGAAGNDAIAPKVRINPQTNEWEISVDGGTNYTPTGVQATGDKGDTGAEGAQGDAIFDKDGIDLSDPDNVTFTLADGVTKITLPKASPVTVGFESYDTFICTPTSNEMTLVLPSTLKETDYTAIVATVSNGNGTDMDIQTRAAAGTNTWGVKVTKPTFDNVGKLVVGSAKVTLFVPQDVTNSKALLKVTMIDTKGKENSVSRVIEWFDGTVVYNTSGTLSEKISNPANVDKLLIIGAVSDDDFGYIRENLTSLSLLDLSKTSLTLLPSRALAFYDEMGLTNNTILKTVILPEGLTTIGNSAFAMCVNLREVNIPNSVMTLGSWMFEGCASLEEVVIPQGVNEIPKSAFYAASGLESITIPSSVTSIGTYAFADCVKLVSVTIPPKVTVLSECMFNMCENLETVNWHDNITTIGDDVFTICRKLFAGKELVLPANVTSVGARAFSFTGATSVKLPEGLKSIANSAFNQCPVANVDLPSSITSLHATAFWWKKVTTVTCRSATPPAIPTTDEYNNEWPPFHEINSSCVLKKPASSDYSAWSSYFGGGVTDL